MLKCRQTGWHIVKNGSHVTKTNKREIVIIGFDVQRLRNEPERSQSLKNPTFHVRSIVVLPTKTSLGPTAMEIVRAELIDVERLAEMNLHLIEDEQHPTTMNMKQLIQRFKQWLENEYTCYCVRQHGSIVAYCLWRDDGKYYYMRQLYVERKHRRKGIATKLLDWLYENVWTDRKVRLDVLAHNVSAVAFYKRYGFRIGVLRMEK